MTHHADCTRRDFVRLAAGAALATAAAAAAPGPPAAAGTPAAPPGRASAA